MLMKEKKRTNYFEKNYIRYSRYLEFLAKKFVYFHPYPHHLFSIET